MSELSRAKDLAQQLIDQAELISTLEADLKEHKEKHRRIEQDLLPDLMLEVGLQEFVLDDGRQIVIEADCKASISKARNEEAMRWLVDNDFGGLVKTKVEVGFGRGELEQAEQLSAALSAEHGDVMVTESVHASTLKAFVKEQLAEGRELPMELFGVHPFSKASIKKK